MNILDRIHSREDLIALREEERELLCSEIRQYLVNSVSKTGGHLASNLGVVELSVALETVFDTSRDRLVFDVGHQSYIHKLLTGRKEGFSSLRQFGGMAGFPKPCESVTDAFVAGHASSSVSIALGMARARTLMGEDYNVVALIGDGAATGGMAYEGLNDAAVSKEPMIVVLNDNAMSIDRNVGGMASHLSKLRTKARYLGMKKRYKSFLSHLPAGNLVFRISRGMKERLKRMLIPSTIFESMGFTYLGPVYGHDTDHLISLLQIAKDMNRPVLLHVITQKGRGYGPAEEHPKLFHGVGKFDPVTGEVLSGKGENYSAVFGRTIVDLADKDNRICAITAAMPGGTGLLDFKKKYPNRLFDVGIAEEHAISMAGGLAKQGMVPVVALYSTFLQRGYDMILQDVCMLGLHVVLAVDRAGLVGEDGETHHGVFDVGFLRQMPGMTVLCPGNFAELESMLCWAVNDCSGPVAVRYPRGGNQCGSLSPWHPDEIIEVISGGNDVAIITYGTMGVNAQEAAKILSERGVGTSVIRILRVNPLPIEALESSLSGFKQALILEETCDGSGVYASLAWELKDRHPDCKLTHLDLGKEYVTHGNVSQLHRHYGLDAGAIVNHIQEVLKVEN